MSDTAAMKERVREATRQVIDPEVGVNILDLGLIYGIEVEADRVYVAMTMTTPACPMGSYLIDSVDEAVRRAVPEVDDVRVGLVWDPPWTPQMMSPAAKEQLGWDE